MLFLKRFFCHPNTQVAVLFGYFKSHFPFECLYHPQNHAVVPTGEAEEKTGGQMARPARGSRRREATSTCARGAEWPPPGRGERPRAERSC